MVSNYVVNWGDPSNRHCCEEHLSLLEQMLKLRLGYWIGSSDRIDVGCRLLGEAMGLNAKTLYSLSIAARYHDIGLTGIPDTILMKQEALTEEERNFVNRHMELGGRFVSKAFPDLPEVIEGIWFHHERLDGKGPHGLKGKEIPLLAGIVALIDSVDAMSHDRPYRKALSFDQLMDELDQQIGRHYLPKAISAFMPLAKNIYSMMLINKKGPTEMEVPIHFSQAAAQAQKIRASSFEIPSPGSP